MKRKSIYDRCRDCGLTHHELSRMTGGRISVKFASAMLRTEHTSRGLSGVAESLLAALCELRECGMESNTAIEAISDAVVRENQEREEKVPVVALKEVSDKVEEDEVEGLRSAEEAGYKVRQGIVKEVKDVREGWALGLKSFPGGIDLDDEEWVKVRGKVYFRYEGMNFVCGAEFSEIGFHGSDAVVSGDWHVGDSGVLKVLNDGF